jgi:DNA-binding transcriptional MerR regulator
MKSFSIKELERLSGIKAHTLRIWEKRYAVLNPGRSEGNTRFYTIEELRRILNISLLNKNGYKVSGICFLSDEQLEQKIREAKDFTIRQQKAVNEMIICMYLIDTEGFESIVDTCMLSWTVDTVLKEIIYKFLLKTGLFWKGNRLTEEHFVVTMLRSKIIMGIERAAVNQRKDKIILLFLPEPGQLDLMLLYTRYLFVSAGFQVLYMGNDISIANLKTVVQVKQPGYLFTYLPGKTPFKVGELGCILQEEVPESRLVIVNNPERQLVKTSWTNIRQLDYEDALVFIGYS